MNGFWDYLKSKRLVIVVDVAFAAIFAVVFALYKISFETIAYPLVLCAALGLAVLVFDYLRVRKKCQELSHIRTLTAEMIDVLPESSTPVEEEYREIIEKLKRELIDTKASGRNSYDDMVEYYTTWVHQIKTPLASMKIQLQSEDSDLSRRMRTELFRTEQYVDMVMAFLRLGSESTDYTFEEVNLDDVIKPSLRKFAPEFIGRKISLNYEAVDTRIVTDEKWFAFVLEQILSNALKYTKQGFIHIYMVDGVLKIEDTGIGIKAEDLPRVFDKGYTGYNGRTDKSASGLGLYLCKRICDRLGIGISIDSKVGEGTCISLNLTQM